MDKNKILDDDNLNDLDFIKTIDTYSIVDKEFNKRRDRKSIWITIGVSAFLISFSILFIIISKMVSINIFNMINKADLKKIIYMVMPILIYHLIGIWILMFITVPIIKRKKVDLN